jgi:hypothetical protein
MEKQTIENYITLNKKFDFLINIINQSKKNLDTIMEIGNNKIILSKFNMIDKAINHINIRNLIKILVVDDDAKDSDSDAKDSDSDAKDSDSDAKDIDSDAKDIDEIDIEFDTKQKFIQLIGGSNTQSYSNMQSDSNIQTDNSQQATNTDSDTESEYEFEEAGNIIVADFMISMIDELDLIRQNKNLRIEKYDSD